MTQTKCQCGCNYPDGWKQTAITAPDREAEIAALRKELAAARKDSARLDWLEGHRVALNRHYHTSYGWKVVISHNVTRLFANLSKIDLNDANFDGTEIRAAIDAAMGVKP